MLNPRFFISARNSVPLVLGEVPEPPLIAADEVNLASQFSKECHVMISCLAPPGNHMLKITRAGQNRATRLNEKHEKDGKKCISSICQQKTCFFISFLCSPESLFTFVFLKWLPRQVRQIGGCFLQKIVANTGPKWHCGKVLPLSSFHKVQQQVPHLSSIELYPSEFYIYGFHSEFLILYSGKNVAGAGLCLCMLRTHHLF